MRSISQYTKVSERRLESGKTKRNKSIVGLACERSNSTKHRMYNSAIDDRTVVMTHSETFTINVKVYSNSPQSILIL
jgi:hypothetical protein